MKPDQREAADSIRRSRATLVEAALACLGIIPGPKQEKAKEDLGWHFDFLAEAVQFGETAIFSHYLDWLSTLFERLQLTPASLDQTLEALKASLMSLSAEAAKDQALAILGTAIEEWRSQTSRWDRSGASKVEGISQDYLDCLLEGNKAEALLLMEGLLREGLGLPHIYLDVIQPAQRELGRLWLLGRINSAQEHFCSSSTQFIMARLCPPTHPRFRRGKRLVAAAAGGELHDIGIRMVSDLFELQGWETYFLGANSPGESVVKIIMEWKPELLCLSATLPTHLSLVAQTIDQVREAFPSDLPRILVGGLAFEEAPKLWKAVGADAWGRDAHEALGLASA